MTQKAEIWKDIPGYEGRYQASNFGRVRSLMFRNLPRTSPLILTSNYAAPYYCVNLYNGTKQPKLFRINVLVLLAFKGSPPKGFQAAHLDGNCKNNRLSNLTWASPKTNSSHRELHGTVRRGTQTKYAKLTEKKVQQIRRIYADGGVTQRELATRFNICVSQICEIVNRNSWKHC